MKVVEKCYSLQPFASEFKDNLCTPILLKLFPFSILRTGFGF